MASRSSASVQPKSSPEVSSSARSRRKPNWLWRERSTPAQTSSRSRNSRSRVSYGSASSQIRMRVAESGSTPPLSARAVLRHDDADPVALDALDPHRGQRGKERRPVVLEDDAPVEQDDRAAIGLRADEPAVALAEPEGREREPVFGERIVGPLGPA